MGRKESNAASFKTNQDDVFGRIATKYDLLCDLFSLGIHRIWKRAVAKKVASTGWETMLDTATGTGDIVLRILKRIDADRQRLIIASDISPEMLKVAEQRVSSTESISVTFKVLDAEKLDCIQSKSVDCYSMSLGLKICNRTAALEEAMRVLKPGGTLVVLEASNIPIAWIHKIYLLYMRICMPLIGWLAAAGDASAYRYLLKGIESFPTAEMLSAELECLGFVNVAFRRYSLGIVSVHCAETPKAE